ncbi:hypothetical protein ACFFT4_20820, partial [Cohnella cellulosilytica]
LPPFSKWTMNSNGAVNGEYSYQLTTSTTTNQPSWAKVNLIIGQQYTYSAVHAGRLVVVFYDITGQVISGSGVSTAEAELTFTVPVNTAYAEMRFDGDSSIGTFTFTNPMLNFGPEPLLFEPQKPSYLYLPDCNLRSNVGGSVADRLYTDGQGKPRVTRRFRETALDGTLAWAFNLDFSGFKRVICPLPGATYVNAKAVKYDGKLLRENVDVDGIDNFQIDVTPSLYITIADTDSGWGESYTPTEDEIKAYFWGWRMYGSNDGLPYTGTNGGKIWKMIDANNNSTYGQGVLVVPTTLNILAETAYKPYRLMYQLSQSVDEPVTYEGSLMLHEGDNQVEVGTGIVVREAASPVTRAAGDLHGINSISGYLSTNPLKNRTEKILRVHKNSLDDRNWLRGIGNILNWYGTGYAYIPIAYFDSAAAYSVTYLALDTYMLGIAPQTISAEYAPNIRESVESLVRELVESRTETSVLANTKAQKQQPQWIASTLRNDWVNFASGMAASYRQNESGEVELRGVIRNGITTDGVVLFYLPTDYKPTRQTVIGVLNYHPSTNEVFKAFLVIDADGKVTIYGAGAGSAISFDGVVFPLK